MVVTVSYAYPAEDIFGAVVDFETGHPISGARVTATVERDMFRPEHLVAVTGDDGQFRFTGVPRVKCRVKAEKVRYGQDERMDRGELPELVGKPLQLRLQPLGVLIVRVIDQTGTAVEGAQAKIFRFDDERASNMAGYATIPADGYRSLLVRGEYKVIVVTAGSGTLLRARKQTFQPTYSPATTDLNRAALIAVLPGKEVVATVQVTLTPAYEVRGKLGVPGYFSQLFIFREGRPNDFYANSGLIHLDRATSEFRISGLASGSYVIQGWSSCCFPKYQDQGMQFRKIVRIVAADVDGLLIVDSDRVSSQ